MKKIVYLTTFILAISLYSQEISSWGPYYIPQEMYGEEETAPETDGNNYSPNYPNYEERYVLWDLNRSRIAPHKMPNDDYQHSQFEYCTNWGVCFDPVKPLNYNLELSRAARFHSYDMGDNGCFQHESCDGTDTFTRINGYYSGYSTAGENIGMGSQYTDVTWGLINEHNNVSTQHPDGHRQNIYTSAFNEVGLGYLIVNGKPYFTEDFGGKSSVSTQTVTAGIHFPQRVNVGTAINFSAIFFDDGDKPAKAAKVIIGIMENGILSRKTELLMDMTEYTTPTDEKKPTWFAAEYKKSLEIQEKGCHLYRFMFVKDSGTIIYYPEEGSLLFGVGKDCKDATGSPIIYTTDEITIEQESSDGGCTFNSNNQYISLLFLLFAITPIVLIRKKINNNR
ncbi:CAP domain-containing protein [bacterium]|nr:CAP domain-containing protein [bacterium]